MARYVVHVRTPKPPAEAFAFMADLTNFADWDPGVARARQVVGDGPGVGAAFDLAVRLPVGTTTLTYETTAYDDDGWTTTVVASNLLLTSEDTITVEADGDGSIVTYDAELRLNSVLGLADPVLGLTFDRIGDRAAAGLVEALSGERVPEPAS
jgi:hypothetical protein